jgi:heme-degrading monooxygenase HmoA
MATVEIAQFKLKSDADEAAFIAAEHLIAKGIILQQPGFISREMTKGADGQWLLIMRWESVAAVEAWGPKLMQDPSAPAFVSQLEFSSMHKAYYESVTA